MVVLAVPFKSTDSVANNSVFSLVCRFVPPAFTIKQLLDAIP
jgi:hypothetical protein